MGLVSKLFMALNHALSSDDATPALLFWDIMENGNFLLKGWYLVTNSYLFTDFPVYFALGLIFGMTPLTLKVGAFVIFLSTVALAAVLVHTVFGRKAGVISTAALLCLPASASSVLLQNNIHVGTIGMALFCLLLIVLI